MPIKTRSTKLPTVSQPTSAIVPRSLSDELSQVLQPVLEAAQVSSSLISNEYPLRVAGATVRLPKLVLLGQRGGGKPISTGIFAGFEPRDLPVVRAVSEVILQLKASLALTRDYALTFYPIVNAPGFAGAPVETGNFEIRYAQNAPSEDVQFFRREFRVWNFEGFISVRHDPESRGLHAVVRSEIIGREVVEEALVAASSALPLTTNPVRVRPEIIPPRHPSFARLEPPADVRPRPFDIELYLPHSDSPFAQADGLFVALTEILRHYRTLIAHARDL
jgi:hypothetical protein